MHQELPASLLSRVLREIDVFINMNYSVNSFKGGYIGDYVGDYHKGY